MTELTDGQMVERARAVIEADSRAVSSALEAVDASFVKAARLLSACKGKVLVCGSGTSGANASRTAHLLSVCGTPAFCLSPNDGLHGGLGVLQPDDVVLALSRGGNSAELNEFCARAKTRCGHLVVVTATKDTPLYKMADLVILLALDDEADLGTVVATGSSMAIAAVVDALAELGRLTRDYSWRDLLFTHPSGAVGLNAEKSLAHLVEQGKG